MHAYLISGEDPDKVLNKATNLSEKLGRAKLEYSITKISQVRELISFLRLSINKPTAILIKDIENATEEALNAFLKILEEPQENITYILTASSEYKIIPTIASRVQIIKVGRKDLNKEEYIQISKFLKMKIGEKFSFIDKLRGREEASDFIKQYILYIHEFIKKEDINLNEIAYLITTAQNAINRLKGNGNINLNLSNFVIKTSKIRFTGSLI